MPTLYHREHDEMMPRINRNLHIVAIRQRDLLVLALPHLRINRVESDDLLLKLLDLALQSLNLRLRHRIAMPIGFKLIAQILRLRAKFSPLAAAMAAGWLESRSI